MSQKTAIPKWPNFNHGLLESVLRGAPSFNELTALSPVQVTAENSGSDLVLDWLFPGNPLLCGGRSRYEFATKTREEWRAVLHSHPLMVPSPMRSVWGLSQENKLSQHTLDGTGPRRFLVVESDHLTFDQQAGLLWHLKGFAPLALVVHSRGKSLHGWFWCDGVPESVLLKFFRYAVALGEDHATWPRCQFVRVPGGLRDNGERQVVMYQDPDALARNWAPLDEIPDLSLSPESPPAGSVRQISKSASVSLGSESEKTRTCSLALSAIALGADYAEAAQMSGLPESNVRQIHAQYGTAHIVANANHQACDIGQIGPNSSSRPLQTGPQKFKNDFHSYRCGFDAGFSADETFQALLSWKVFAPIREHLMQSYPVNWQEFARKDITRCYPKFANFSGPKVVSDSVLEAVQNAIIVLGRKVFKTAELYPIVLETLSKISLEQIQRALKKTVGIKPDGENRGRRWIVIDPNLLTNSEDQNPSSPKFQISYHTWLDRLDSSGNTVHAYNLCHRAYFENGLAHGRLELLPDSAGQQITFMRRDRFLDGKRIVAELLRLSTADTGGIYVISGPAGSGKTIYAARLATKMHAIYHTRTKVCAITWKAAAVLQERMSDSFEVTSIHQGLDIPRNPAKFLTKEKNVDLVIIDEASFFDESTFAMVLSRIPTGAVLIIAGDVEQIPSVGPGRVLSDLIEIAKMSKEHDVRIWHKAMRKQHRFSSDSAALLSASQAVLEGTCPLDGPGFQLLLVSHEDEVVHKAAEISRTLNCNAISPLKSNEYGAARIAAEITGRRQNDSFRLGDVVVATQTLPRLGITNGEILKVVQGNRRECFVRNSSGKEFAIRTKDLADPRCQTGHFLQGTEEDRKVIALQCCRVISRNWLYSAITRAKELCVVVCTERTLHMALAHRSKRHTRLHVFFREAMEIRRSQNKYCIPCSCV